LHWYYQDEGETRGPVGLTELRSLAATGAISPLTPVAEAGGEDWLTYADLTENQGNTACSQCGKSYELRQLFRFSSLSVCEECKKPFFQRLRQGIRVDQNSRFGGFWIRVAARLIDSLLIGVANAAIYMPFLSMMADPTASLDPETGEIESAFMVMTCGMYFAQFLVNGLYEVIFVAKWAATPGKMVCGLKVVRGDGTRVGWGLAIGRYFGYMMSSLSMGIGFLLVAFDSEKRSLHDHIANTRVVKTR